MDILAASIAFVALGATFLGAALLLLFNPRSREVRWYTLFNATIVLWLLTQGMDALDTGDTLWDVAHGMAVTLLPGTFVASGLVDAGIGRGWWSWAVLAVGAVLAVLVGDAVTGTAAPALEAVLLAWHAVGWLGGSWLIARGAARHPRARAPRVLTTLALLLIVPVSVVVGMLLGGWAFFNYVLPLMMVGVQLLVFYGVVRLRFYDIDVRTARTGELAAQIATGERLALLGELSASVAHEVRNPLTGIRSLAQRLAEDDLDSGQRRRYAGVVLEEVGRLDRVVGNLLGIARHAPTSYSAGPTPLAPLFDDLALLVSTHASRKGVTLRFEADDVSAAAPREALAQALLNLVLNAIAHSPERGRTTLLARAADTERGADHAGGDVVLVVRDSGSGIPRAERERVFEPFVTATGGGVGLGLGMVRRLADELGWSLEVDDAPGGGAEFRIVVPAARTAPIAQHAAAGV